MGTSRSLGKWVGPALLLACALAGCTVSVQPWTKPAPVGPEAAALAAKGQAPYPANYPPNGLNPNPAAPNGIPGAAYAQGYSPGGYQAGGYQPGLPNTSAANESTSLLIRQLNEKDDQIRVLQEQNL